jgi:hypothetical protein
VDVDGTLINANSGTKIKPGDAAQYLEEGFHGDTAKATEGVKPGISTDWKDYGKGDVVCKETQNEVAYDKFENGKGEEGTHPPLPDPRRTRSGSMVPPS